MWTLWIVSEAIVIVAKEVDCRSSHCRLESTSCLYALAKNCDGHTVYLHMSRRVIANGDRFVGAPRDKERAAERVKISVADVPSRLKRLDAWRTIKRPPVRVVARSVLRDAAATGRLTPEK